MSIIQILGMVIGFILCLGPICILTYYYIGFLFWVFNKIDNLYTEWKWKRALK